MNYETFFSDWMKRYGAPPSARDFSDDKKEQAGFRYWARKNGLALASKQKQNSESFQTFYREYLREYGKPPRACDYGLTANEHKLFSEWAKREGLSLSKQPKSRYYIELANLVEPYKREGKSRKEYRFTKRTRASIRLRTTRSTLRTTLALANRNTLKNSATSLEGATLSPQNYCRRSGRAILI